jgi:hypothetical protein
MHPLLGLLGSLAARSVVAEQRAVADEQAGEDRQNHLP